MQFGYPYLIRLSFFEIQSNPDLVLNCRIRLDRDPETGSCSTLIDTTHSTVFTMLIEIIVIYGQGWIQFEMPNIPSRAFAINGKICTTLTNL